MKTRFADNAPKHRKQQSLTTRLHELEDRARYTNPDSRQYRQLMRQYARVMNAAWRQPLAQQELETHEDRRRKQPGKDHFRARTIAQNAITELETAVTFSRYGRTKYVEDNWPELAVKAARAVRKIRPDLFVCA